MGIMRRAGMPKRLRRRRSTNVSQSVACHTLQMALEAEGHVVETATDGPEGIRRFREREGWDLALLDQRLPGMEGWEVLRRIHEMDPSARVVMVTANGTHELALDAMRSWATDFLRKPFTPEVLRGCVRGTLAPPRGRVRASGARCPRFGARGCAELGGD